MDHKKFDRFINTLQNGYNKEVAYHNATHAADVTQTSYYFFNTCGFMQKAQVSDLELITVLISGASHDFEHP